MLLLESLINKSLELDVQAEQYLQKLAGKILAIELHKKYYISFALNAIQIEKTLNTEQIPDATVQGPLKAFIHFALTKNAAAAIDLGLSFEGDTEVLENVQALFRDLNIDWEEALAKNTGDIFAHQVGKSFRYLERRSSQILGSTADSLSEYLQEESGILPTPAEVDYFMDAVDTLRADTDRLEARLVLLEQNPVGADLRVRPGEG